VPAFHPALGLGRVRRDDLHGQRLHGPSKLRLGALASQVLIDPRISCAFVDAVAIDVEGLRQPVAPRIPPEDVQGSTGILCLVETGVRAVRGVVDHHHQHRPLSPSFPPVMMGSVHLDQFSRMGPAFPVLPMLLALALLLPDPGLQQPPPQGLVVDPQPVFRQVLAGQRRPKVRVALYVSLEHLFSKRTWEPPIRCPSPPAMDQPCIAFFPVPLPHPFHLPIAHLAKPRSLDQLEHSLPDPA